MRRKLNRSSICTRKPSNMSDKPNFLSRAKSSAKRRLSQKYKFTCKDGVLKGESLYLSTAGTMLFTMNGKTGFYNHLMEWVEL